MTTYSSGGLEQTLGPHLQPMRILSNEKCKIPNIASFLNVKAAGEGFRTSARLWTS